MSLSEQKMRMVLSQATALGLPAEDFIDLVQAAAVGSPLEQLMRIRALAELSSRTDVATLITLAAAAARHGSAINALVAALSDSRH